MPRPFHFEIHADNPQRAIEFYTKMFGWTFQRWNGPTEYWLVTTGDRGTPGIDGGLLRRDGPAPLDMPAVNAFVCTVDVPSLDAMILRTSECGGTIVVAKMAVPGVGWLAYAHDSEGNVFGMMQQDAAAR